MTEFEIKAKGGVTYLKEELQRILKLSNGDGKFKGLANFKTVVLYPKSATPEEILKSLEVIKKDLELRAEEEKKSNP